MNWTIGRRLLACLVAVMLPGLVMTVTSILSFNSVGAGMHRLVHQDAPTQVEVSGIASAMSELASEDRGVLVSALVNDPAGFEDHNSRFRETATRLKQQLDELTPRLDTARGRQLTAGIVQNAEDVISAHEEIVSLSRSGNGAKAAGVLREKTASDLARARTGATELLAIVGDGMKDASAKSEDMASTGSWVVFLSAAISAICGVIALLVMRGVNAGLRNLARDLGAGAEQTAGAAAQIAGASQSLAQGASEQAASLEQTSASTEEINSMARRNAENSSGASSLVEGAEQKVSLANQSLGQMVAAMGEIKSSSDRIAKIIKTIDEIAFQTNILALNAAVEAARAGEAGMGFAVVADEVRSLAQRCTQAARDTAALIEESIGRSNEGQTRVSNVDEAIRAITTDSAKIRVLVDEVNLGSQEQARGIEQIGKAVLQMQQVTQNTAASAEQSAAAAEELAAQSVALKDLTGRLSAMVDSDAASAVALIPAVAGRAPTVARLSPAVPRRTLMARKPVAALESAPCRPEPTPAAIAIPLDEDDFKAF